VRCSSVLVAWLPWGESATPRRRPLATLRTVYERLPRHGNHANSSAPGGAQGSRRRLEGGATRPNVVDQNHARRHRDTRLHREDPIRHPSPLSAAERMEGGHRPRALKERRDRARQYTRGGGGDQRRMIEAALTETCGIGGNGYERRVAAEILLNSADRTLQAKSEWVS
jgi:hypothetical protein